MSFTQGHAPSKKSDLTQVSHVLTTVHSCPCPALAWLHFFLCLFSYDLFCLNIFFLCLIHLANVIRWDGPQTVVAVEKIQVWVGGLDTYLVLKHGWSQRSRSVTSSWRLLLWQPVLRAHGSTSLLNPKEQLEEGSLWLVLCVLCFSWSYQWYYVVDVTDFSAHEETEGSERYYFLLQATRLFQVILIPTQQLHSRVQHFSFFSKQIPQNTSSVEGLCSVSIEHAASLSTPSQNLILNQPVKDFRQSTETF